MKSAREVAHDLAALGDRSCDAPGREGGNWHTNLCNQRITIIKSYRDTVRADVVEQVARWLRLLAEHNKNVSPLFAITCDELAGFLDTGHWIRDLAALDGAATKDGGDK